ncbi:MAG: YgjV family protein [Candidatus Riflebacteria bacterium]|nr:YgjV family protein [Candidatus Riflebacteria bacterium]
MSNYEIVSLVASIFVAVSLTINSSKWMRILNMIGCICFVTYGILIKGWSLAALNTYGTAINIYHLIKMSREAKSEEKEKAAE